MHLSTYPRARSKYPHPQHEYRIPSRIVNTEMTDTPSDFDFDSIRSMITTGFPKLTHRLTTACIGKGPTQLLLLLLQCVRVFPSSRRRHRRPWYNGSTPALHRRENVARRHRSPTPFRRRRRPTTFLPRPVRVLRHTPVSLTATTPTAPPHRDSQPGSAALRRFSCNLRRPPSAGSTDRFPSCHPRRARGPRRRPRAPRRGAGWCSRAAGSWGRCWGRAPAAR